MHVLVIATTHAHAIVTIAPVHVTIAPATATTGVHVIVTTAMKDWNMI